MGKGRSFGAGVNYEDPGFECYAGSHQQLRKRVWRAWQSMGGMACEAEGFACFFLRFMRALESGYAEFGMAGFGGLVQDRLRLLGDVFSMRELERPLKEGRGHSDQQVFPISPMSMNGKFIKRGSGEDLETDVLYHGGNLLVSVLNWMHGGLGEAKHEVGLLSAAHRRIHDRVSGVLRAMVVTDEPILTHGGLDTFLQQTQLYSGCGVVLALGERGGVPEKAADVPLAQHMDTFDPGLAEQIRNPQVLLLPARKRPKRIKKGYVWVSSYPELVKRNVQAGLQLWRAIFGLSSKQSSSNGVWSLSRVGSGPHRPSCARR